MPIKRIRSTIASLQAVERVADRSGNVTIRSASVTGITGNYTVCHHPFAVILEDVVFSFIALRAAPNIIFCKR